ncbi:DUF3060 domain-containing protein [Pseudoduganella sp. HUAS MS19]
MKLGMQKAVAATVAMILMTGAFAQEDAVGEIEVTDKLINISGSGHQRSFPCDGRKLEVVGSGHTVTTTGVCSEVEILGVGNTVTVEVKPKGRLAITGTDHTVRWKSEGKIAQSVTGTGHSVTRIK